LPLSELFAGSGCLSDDPPPGAARYMLDRSMKDAIAQALDFLAADEPATPDERVAAQLAAMNCYACHTRDGLGGPEPARNAYFEVLREADLGDEGRLPPPLDGVGAKLTEAWLRDVLHGGEKVRPYMATRMPDYGATHGAALADAILAADAADLVPEVDTGLEHHHRNRYGRELLGVNALGCITCHGINGQPSAGIPGVDLAMAPARLRLGWFKEYLLDPPGYRPLTRMPSFFVEGKSTYPALFKGDPEMQIEAMWTYLKEADVSRLPEGMEPTGEFTLEPVDAPIVHRTFMTGVGTHALAIGFPEGVHAAYNTKEARLAVLWKGAFLSAESAWANRFTPYVSPLGDDVRELPEGPSFAVLESIDKPWPKSAELIRYTGYRMEDSGPVLLYVADDLVIEERLEPLPDGAGIRRQLNINNAPRGLMLRIGASPDLEANADAAPVQGELSIESGERSVTHREVGGRHEVLVTLPDGETTLDYTW